MTDIVERLEKNTRCLGHGYNDVDPLSKEAAKEIRRLRKYEWIVKYIHTDPYELSYEKKTFEYIGMVNGPCVYHVFEVHD